MAGENDFWQNYNETNFDKLRDMPESGLEFYYNYFSEMRLELHGRDQKWMSAAENRIDLIDKEMSRRSSDAQHNQTHRLGRRTLFWARLAVIAAVAVPIALALLSESRFKKPLGSPQATSSIAPIPSPSAKESTSAVPETSPTPM